MSGEAALIDGGGNMLDLVAQTLRISVPYTLAALGGVLSERSGVVNIGLEGMLLMGAFGAAAGTLVTGSAWLGLGCGIVCGALLGGVHGAATGLLQVNHVVSGLAINLLAAGLTRLLLQRFYHSSSNSPRLEGVEALVHGSSWMALLSHPLVWMTVGAVVLVHGLLQKTVWGLRIQAAGESPRAVEAAGLQPWRLRMGALLMGGGLAGLGGVWLAFDQHTFSDGMSGGRGYIALAALIFGGWRPIPAALACVLFGAAETLQLTLQGGSGALPVQLIQSLPYVLTLVALCGAVRRTRAPAALGQ